MYSVRNLQKGKSLFDCHSETTDQEKSLPIKLTEAS